MFVISSAVIPSNQSVQHISMVRIQRHSGEVSSGVD
jgi:hypothetical protein